MFDEELRRVEETRPPCILLDLRELAAQRRARRAGRCCCSCAVVERSSGCWR